MHFGIVLNSASCYSTGTIITNHVEASYIDPDSDSLLTSVSNEVSITLRPVAAVLLEQDLQQTAVVGETLYLTHTLSNFGKVPDIFALTADKPTLTIDVPVDPALQHQGQQLGITKQVSNTQAEMGDVLTYTISISNQTGEDVRDVQVHDSLPVGSSWFLTLLASLVCFKMAWLRFQVVRLILKLERYPMKRC